MIPTRDASPWISNHGLATIISGSGVPDSPESVCSAAESDISGDMDLDDDAVYQMSTTNSKLPSSPWTLRASPPIQPINRPQVRQQTSRVPTPIVHRPVRPRPAPLQNSGKLRTNASDIVPRSSLSALFDRLPSPVDEDEPHTPTTAAGSQLSLLSVNDMDIDSAPTPTSAVSADVESETDVTTPSAQSTSHLDAVVVRKQRQRSGAFISSPDVARKFSMGYREDCEKCRNRVPGHMNHLLGT